MPEEDVLLRRKVPGERKFLMDRNDTPRQSLARRPQAPLLPVEEERAPVGLVDAAEDLDQRRFSGAVLAHDRMDLAGTNGEVHIGEDDVAVEALGESPCLKHGPLGA